MKNHLIRNPKQPLVNSNDIIQNNTKQWINHLKKEGLINFRYEEPCNPLGIPERCFPQYQGNTQTYISNLNPGEIHPNKFQASYPHKNFIPPKHDKIYCDEKNYKRKKEQGRLSYASPKV